jgi:hypothetical protein
MSAEINRQKNFDNQVLDFVKRNPDFVTSGAKKYYKRVVVGYVILAIAAVIGIWAFTNRADRNLRSEINKLSVAGCIGSIATYNKFNDLVKTNIETQQESLIINLRSGDTKRAAINRRSIKRLKSDLIIPPTAVQCNKPILK